MSPPVESPLLSLRGVSKAFAGVEVLRDISLDFFPEQGSRDTAVKTVRRKEIRNARFV